MAGILFTSGRFSATDSAGNPLVGGTVTSYAGGTTTPKATYADAALATPNANPVTLDANGSAAIFFGPGLYTIVVADSAGVVRYTTDNVNGSDAYISAAPSADQTIAGHKLAVPTGIDGPLGTVTPASVLATDVTVNASTSLVRLNNFTALGQGVSINLGPDGVTRDVGARWAGGYFLDSVNGGFKVRAVSPAGTAKDYAPRLSAGVDFAQHTNTGNTSLNVVVTRTLLGGTLGAAGGFSLRVYINASVQGATPSQVFLYANGTSIASFAVIASQTGIYKWEVTFGNSGSAGSQFCYALPTYFGGSTTPQVIAGTAGAFAINTLVDVAFDIRVQNGANTDNIHVDMMDMEILTTFAL